MPNPFGQPSLSYQSPILLLTIFAARQPRQRLAWSPRLVCSKVELYASAEVPNNSAVARCPVSGVTGSSVEEPFMARGFARNSLQAGPLSLLAGALLVAGLTASGCQKSESGTPIAVTDPKTKASTNDASRPPLKPNELLSRMVQAYRTAISYADAAQLRITLERETQASNNPEPLNASVTLVRPNEAR